MHGRGHRNVIEYSPRNPPAAFPRKSARQRDSILSRPDAADELTCTLLPLRRRFDLF